MPPSVPGFSRARARASRTSCAAVGTLACLWSPLTLAQGEPLVVSGGLAALAAVLIVVLSAVLGVFVERHRRAGRMNATQRRASALESLVTGSVWQTDAAHCWVRVPAEFFGVAQVGSRFSACFDGAAPGGSNLQAALAAGQVVPELVLADARGEAFPAWRISAQPLTDDQGTFSGYLGVLQADAASPAQAPAARSQAVLDNEAFSYTVSHDLRAPLRVVTGFATILKEDSAHQLDRVGRDHLERVLGAAARMDRMIDALLALAKLSSQPLERHNVDLSRLAEFIVDDLRREQPARAVEVRIEPNLSAQGDPALLRVLLENLLGNAWKYSAKCEQAHLEFGSAHLDGRRVFVVRDNGAGFDMRVADRLFGAFQRLHSASDFDGSGVGLASARRIVRRHGGDIWAEAEVGRGARFYFTLAG